jgi:uncharacterized protein YndB with AHSA1/START domain
VTKVADNNLEVTVQRVIPAACDAVFDGWLDPEVPGNPWNFAEEFSLDARPRGLFYFRARDKHHYGRFLKLERPNCIQHTWVSANTLGEESLVSVTFEKEGEETLMTLVHSGIPDTERGRRHENGWSFFLEEFAREVVMAQAGRTR